MTQNDIDIGWDYINNQLPNDATATLFGEDDDPKVAAESVKLAADTGTPAAVIYADPERFKRDQLARWSSEVIRENPRLQTFLVDDDIAAKISRNDIANLDEASQKIGLLNRAEHVFRTPDRLANKIFPNMWQGAQEGFGPKPIGSWLDEAIPGFHQQNPMAGAAWTVLGYPVEALFRTLNAGTMAVAAGASTTAEEIYATVTGNPSEAKRFGRDIGAIVEAELNAQTGRKVPGEMHAQVLGDMIAQQQARAKVRQELDAVKSWIDAGEEPPPGVSPWLDKIRENQSREGVKALEEAARASDATETRELSPETYAKFVRQHESAHIEVNGAAIQKLYGDKLPEVDDGVLGHVIIGDQLETALITGGDVTIPIDMWLSTIEPDVRKALKDDVRVRPGSLTLNEIKDKAFEPKKQLTDDDIDSMGPSAYEPENTYNKDQQLIAGKRELLEADNNQNVQSVADYTKSLGWGPLPPPLPQVRAAAGLEPMFALGDRKVRLERTKQEQNYTGDTQFHDFDLLDQEGGLLGSVNLSEQKGGKTLYIEMINAGSADKKFYDPNFLGPALIRDLLRQLKAEFPNAETITGHRVSGAREKADTYNEPHAMPVVRLAVDGAQQIDAFRQLLTPDDLVPTTQAEHDAFMKRIKERPKNLGQVAQGIEVQSKLPEDWTAKQHQVAQAVQDELGRIAPQATSRVVSENLSYKGNTAAGLYLPKQDMILVSLDSVDPVGFAGHEAIHHLYRNGLFSEKEWTALKEQAVVDKWADQFNITKRYKDFSDEIKVEESIAEAYRAWRNGRLEVKDVTVFERIKQFFEKLKARVKEILGRDFTWDEIFQQVEEGRVGRREVKAEEGDQALAAVQPELPGTRRAEDTPPFQSGAMTPAMTAQMQKRYMELIKKRNEADLETATSRAERFQKAQQTEAWKRDRAEMRVEVEREINNRPDVAADLFFSRGELYGEPLGGRPKIDPASLDPELAERLAATDWVKKGGMDANDAAALFGFRTPEEMFNALAEYQAQRPEGIGAKRQRDALVDAETDRQMELRYGRLDDNIIAEAREQAASETQLQLLHEETFFLASQANKEFPLTRSQMRSWAEENFGKATFADTTSAKWFQTAGKVGRQAEEALLKGDPATAFTAKQQQYFAMSMAQQAIKLEKERRQFEKSIEKFKKREVKGIDREFTDFIQEMMIGSNIPLRMTMDEIQQSKLFHGNTSLKTFVDDGLGKGWGLDAEISPELQHGVFKDIKTMSVNDFRDLKDAVDSLAFVGRRTAKIFAQGRLQDKNAVIDSIIDNLKQRPKLDPDREIGTIHKILAATKRPEQIIKDLDDHAELGPAFRNLWEPMTVSSAKFLELERDLTAKAEKMTSGNKKWMKSLEEGIENDFFFDPHDGTLFNLNRGHLVRIALNWGNEGNIKKFVEGWAAYDKPTKEQSAAFRARLEETLQKNMRPEDWQYVHDVWDIFAGWQDQLDTVHRNTSGKLPKWVRPDAIKLPDGSTISEGGYFPLIPDKTRLIPGTGFDPLPNIKNGVMQRDYYRPTTTKSHMMDRQVNAKYRVGFLGDMGEVALRMQQVMHDIAYRESLMDVSGLLFDKRLRNAVKERYSPAYLQQLDAWLVRQANHLNYDEIAMQGFNNVLQRTRQNLVAWALPLNLNVVLSPALALTHPGQWMRTLWDYRSMEKIANEHSRVIPHTEYNLDRDFREHIESLAQRRGWDRTRVEATKLAYWPMIKLEQRLRTVTFNTEFDKARAKGLSDYDASQIADSAVRERHGAQTMTDLPTFMASNEGYKAFTVFMGYFNTMDNWSRQIPGQLRRAEYMNALTTAWGAVIVPAMFGALLFNKSKEDDSYWKIAVKAFGLQLTQGIPFMREAANYTAEGFKPGTPLGSVLDAFYQTGRDVYKLTTGKPEGKNVVKHITGVAGLGFGVPGTAQAGRTGQFMYDYAKGKQRPRDIWEWMRGIRTGEARLKKGGS